MVKNLPAMQETQVPSLGLEVLLRREWQPTLVLFPRKFHGQRSLVCYSLWDLKELDTTVQRTLPLPIIRWKRDELQSFLVIKYETSINLIGKCQEKWQYLYLSQDYLIHDVNFIEKRYLNKIVMVETGWLLLPKSDFFS